MPILEERNQPTVCCMLSKLEVNPFHSLLRVGEWDEVSSQYDWLCCGFEERELEYGQAIKFLVGFNGC